MDDTNVSRETSLCFSCWPGFDLAANHRYRVGANDKPRRRIGQDGVGLNWIDDGF